MKEKILSILKEIKPECDFENCSDFIEADYLDSYDVIELVDLLEQEFSVKINGLDILPENFCNLDRIEGTIKKSSES